MSERELDAAGITDPKLRASYAECRDLLAEHGKTYHLATLLLPPGKRPYVQALYGFARYADEIVDDLSSTLSDAEKAATLDAFAAEVRADLDRGSSDHPITRALVDTVTRWDIDRRYLDAFLDSMRMDLTVTEYATYDDLMTYVYGSAAVIGLQMVPILEHPGVPRAVVEPYAADLGVAFQLANFIRDVGEDLRRGRIYLPMEDLALFGVDREHLERGVVDGPVRRLLAFEVARCREVYRAAWPGLRLLHPASQECMKTAFRLYGGILDAVERADYQVLDRRVAVSNTRRAAVALPALARAIRARRTSPVAPRP
ncbi:phytoene/squalene synthase family protein [Cryptosporangium arvum]|uniref:phytoene/squalene synthase family protein n=1 Tax=Cryptosporangium arvum TaxID=80871 RepID=UPI0004B47C5C|nr:phytoene/squalene synthase family protein [Cryptosporangium arvum]